MSKQRYTIETLASGQPRAYADSIHHVRVSFEWNGWADHDADLEPDFISEEAARRRLGRMSCGFIERTRAEAQWFDMRLDWLKAIDGKPASEVIEGGDPRQTCASIWEFHTTSPYTD